MVEISELVTALTIIFITASVVMFILDRLSHPTIPAYILSGILIGSLVEHSQLIGLSQLGIAFLVFIFGIKTDLTRIKAVAEESVAVTFIQVTVVGSAAYVVASGLGLNPVDSLYFSIAAALSSSLVGLEIIESEIDIELLHGRLAESIQLIQDLVAIMAVLVISSLPFTIQAASTKIMVGGGLILSALIFKNTVFDFLAKSAKGSRELLMLLGLTSLTGFMAIANHFELSIIVGSFAAGLGVAKFPHNIEILDTVNSLKDFFSAIFFVTLGALLTWPGTLGLMLSLTLIVSTVLLTPVITGISLVMAGYDRRTSYLTGLGLDQVSEFALILAIQGYITNSISDPVFHAIIFSATATMIISSYTSRYEEEIYDYFGTHNIIDINNRKIKERTQVEDDLEDHIILIGYDTQGKRMAEILEEADEPFVVLENDPEKVSEVRTKHEQYVFGDAFDISSWERAKYKDAKLIISTIPQYKISKHLLSLDTDAGVILRSSTIPEAAELLDDGALYVNVPDLLSAEQLIDHVRGSLENVNYREELRRRNLLEVRKYLQSEEG